ncbi:carboxylesterase/lipase family protein [Chloroflexota bacterium]
MNPIKLDSGRISGIVIGEPGSEIYVFRGIPYAAPPVDELRWKLPHPVIPWTDVRECTSYSFQAAQYPDQNMPEGMKIIPSSEDCLYVNVITPSMNPADRLPVMVWLHGGGLRYGSANDTLCNNFGLPQHGVVQVNVNNRLGIMGLFAHPFLTEESPQHTSGNYMFLDMIAALQWVQRNIASFGGDPENVTIFGESGGGLKVAALLASPLASGLFHRAIVESGGRVFDTPSLNEMESFGERLFNKLDIHKENDPLAAARAIPWETVIDIDQELNVEMGPEYMFMGPWHIVHDGWFLPDTLVNMFQTGSRNQVPYLMVSNKGELTGPGFIIADSIIKDYLRLLKGPSTAESRGYAAIFDQVPENWRHEGCVASHAMELHYVFGGLDDTEAWARHMNGYTASGAKSPTPSISDSDRAVAENIMTIWTHFARTGNPSVKGLIEWPAWYQTSDEYLLITDPLQIKNGYSDFTNIEPDRSSQNA